LPIVAFVFLLLQWFIVIRSFLPCKVLQNEAFFRGFGPYRGAVQNQGNLCSSIMKMEVLLALSIAPAALAAKKKLKL